MSTRGPVPTSDAELPDYLNHLAGKIDTHAPVLAITQQDVATLKADAALVEWTLKVVPGLRASAQQFTAFKDMLVDGTSTGTPVTVPELPKFPPAPAAVTAGVVPRTRALVQRIKKSPGYTEAIGKDLGIVAPETIADDNPKPRFTATALPGGQVRLDWVKAGFSGVVIQCKRAGDADFVYLDKDNYSPYVDTRPSVQAGTNETRQYRMRYLKKDDEVGEWSDIVTAVTIG